MLFGPNLCDPHCARVLLDRREAFRTEFPDTGNLIRARAGKCRRCALAGIDPAAHRDETRSHDKQRVEIQIWTILGALVVTVVIDLILFCSNTVMSEPVVSASTKCTVEVRALLKPSGPPEVADAWPVAHDSEK